MPSFVQQVDRLWTEFEEVVGSILSLTFAMLGLLFAVVKLSFLLASLILRVTTAIILAPFTLLSFATKMIIFATKWTFILMALIIFWRTIEPLVGEHTQRLSIECNGNFISVLVKVTNVAIRSVAKGSEIGIHYVKASLHQTTLRMPSATADIAAHANQNLAFEQALRQGFTVSGQIMRKLRRVGMVLSNDVVVLNANSFEEMVTEHNVVLDRMMVLETRVSRLQDWLSDGCTDEHARFKCFGRRLSVGIAMVPQPR